jgi:hypothetical protein
MALFTAAGFKNLLRNDLKRLRLQSKFDVPVAEFYELLIRHGKFFSGFSPMKGDAVIQAHFNKYPARAAKCFLNCQRFVLTENASTAAYYEGCYIVPDSQFVTVWPHAWLVDTKRKVYDPTFERQASCCGHPTAGVVYLGVPFTKEQVNAHVSGPVFLDLGGVPVP